MSEASEILKELRRTMLQGASLTDTDRGYHRIVISFETLEEMQEARKALFNAIRKQKDE